MNNIIFIGDTISLKKYLNTITYTDNGNSNLVRMCYIGLSGLVRHSTRFDNIKNLFTDYVLTVFYDNIHELLKRVDECIECINTDMVIENKVMKEAKTVSLDLYFDIDNTTEYIISDMLHLLYGKIKTLYIGVCTNNPNSTHYNERLKFVMFDIFNIIDLLLEVLNEQSKS